MDKYRIEYAVDALEDIRDIYEYIAFTLKETDTAQAQVNRIREAARGLDAFPLRNKILEFEPFQSMGMRQVVVDNFIIFYLTDNDNKTVKISRILYGKRSIPEALSE